MNNIHIDRSIFFSVSDTPIPLEKENPRSPNRNRTYDPPITSSVTLPQSYAVKSPKLIGFSHNITIIS